MMWAAMLVATALGSLTLSPSLIASDENMVRALLAHGADANASVRI